MFTYGMTVIFGDRSCVKLSKFLFPLELLIFPFKDRALLVKVGAGAQEEGVGIQALMCVARARR